jgi:glycosyltransferase involved in cell wall biosynthesis
MDAYPPPPQFASLAAPAPEPFWSVMIPTYNRATYLERTLASVLAQDPGPQKMQIEVVDDASTSDDPGPLVRRAGGGRVAFFRQPHRLGTSANYNSCVERSVGQWVHILNSDDLVLPGFYERLRGTLEGRNDVGAAFCRHAYVDVNEKQLGTSDFESLTAGIIPDFIDRIGVAQTICSPSVMVVRRSVYGDLGGFRKDLPCAGDWEMWIRIAAHYPVWYEPEILAAWREHSRQSSVAFAKLGQDIADMRRCVEISRSWFPSDRADDMSRRAREYLSFWAFDNAESAFAEAELTVAFRQVYEGLKCSTSLRVMKGLRGVFFSMARGVLRGTYARGKSLFTRGTSRP